ncbi:MAG: T9SS type A sorting domain-containing protein [Flavobacteriaceae bacterium]|nr:T9SS type A sorting domain-containing protein [Flavobacteriaceae bacterium]
MKTKLLYLFFVILGVTATKAQETAVNLTMTPGYANQVFYKLSTDTQTPVVADSWDIAMLRTSNYSMGLRINDATGTEVFEASNNPNDWANIDIANESSWVKLYNSEIEWNEGAISQGSATYGWGEYNSNTHHVEGTVIFVFKYADGTYVKFFNEDYYGGYTFQYSVWDANTSSWGTDQTMTVPNGTSNVSYNYYSFSTNQQVTVAPDDTDWDLVFTKYFSDYYGDQSLYYPVTGVLHSSEVEVAQNDEPGGMPDNPTLTYSTDINTIGYDWKSYGSTGFTVNSDIAYYVKYADDTVYRIYFTSFSGSSTGDLTFNFEDVTSVLSMEEVTEEVTFGIYPNPSVDKKINLVYDNRLDANNNEVAIFSTTGQKVFQSSLNKNSGFYNKTLDLSNLNTGVYMLKFTSGAYSATKKIILK